MPNITVEDFFKARRRDLELTLLNNEAGMRKMISSPAIYRPGLALTGFFDRFEGERVQVLGETEIGYVRQLPPERLREICGRLFAQDIPVLIVTKGLVPPSELNLAADEYGTAVLSSRLTTVELTNRLAAYLDLQFAPTINVHGSLVDVYGVGLLYTGKSGIGKSEVALDLVERGHRLVADDVVKITRTAPDVIIGSSSELLGHHMEIRGVGIIDIEELFGIRAIRMQKRIEVEVNLTLWSETEDYERLGIEDRLTTVLGVELPVVKVPISPGKNITVISEVIAMNHMLKVYGENSALEFTKKLTQKISRQSQTMGYLEADYE